MTGFNLQESPPEDSGQSRVLFTRLRSLGDTVLMTPMLTVMKRVLGWQVGVVIETPYEQILRDNPNIDCIFVIENHRNRWMARLRTIRKIRAFRPTLAVDLHGGTTSALITALSGAQKSVGYLHSRHSYLYNVKVPDSREVWGREQVHTVEHQLSILKHLGFPVEPIPPPEIPVDAEGLESIKDLLAGQGVSGEFILIHPAAAFDTKQWDAQKFASLATRLIESGQEVVITAGPGEGQVLEEIREHCSSRVRFIEPLPLRKFSALTSLCSLYVGNDTGSTHMVAAQGKKIVVIFGSSDFKVWYPWNTEHQLIKSDLPCMPCPGYFCLHYDEPRCIRSIPVEPVLEAVQSML
ncbi:MAG: glycosyltransferase family 9 protein [Acidobacteria bacterium]|nr:glycosyltransferase family 9 protein [Acidobacteriota bacterium]